LFLLLLLLALPTWPYSTGGLLPSGGLSHCIALLILLALLFTNRRTV